MSPLGLIRNSTKPIRSGPAAVSVGAGAGGASVGAGAGGGAAGSGTTALGGSGALGISGTGGAGAAATVGEGAWLRQPRYPPPAASNTRPESATSSRLDPLGAAA